MKKNNAMRLASVLLVLTLLTTCAISGTFAKYTTSTTGGDKARVAYWGFGQAAATTIDLFDGQYANVTSSGEADGFSNVVAPGTEKSTTFAFAYTDYKTNAITAPEVAYTFTVNPTITGDYDELDKNANFKWTLKADHWPSGREYQTAAELLAAINQPQTWSFRAFQKAFNCSFCTESQEQTLMTGLVLLNVRAHTGVTNKWA